MAYSEQKYTDLIGKTFTSVQNIENEELVFEAEGGQKYKFYHKQDCCESVQIVDIIGDLDDLVGSPIIMAEEVIHEQENPDSVGKVDWLQESFT